MRAPPISGLLNLLRPFSLSYKLQLQGASSHLKVQYSLSEFLLQVQNYKKQYYYVCYYQWSLLKILWKDDKKVYIYNVDCEPGLFEAIVKKYYIKIAESV